jgi:hypothetical protein
MKQRLNYEYFDTSKNQYVEEKEGVPQGGIDSPYLWNIYMAEFDDFVINYTHTYFAGLNKKARGNAPIKKVIMSSERRKIEKSRHTLRFLAKTFRLFGKDHIKLEKIFSDKKTRADKVGLSPLLKTLKWKEIVKQKGDTNPLKYQVIKTNRKLTHKFFKLPAGDPNRKHLRFKYSRYADDWIFITNAPPEILNLLKEKFKEFLFEKLSATMAAEKTFITDMRKKPACFLGFEIRTYAHNQIQRVKKTKQSFASKTSTGKTVFALPDKKRLINRLHMKGYCHSNGKPKEIGWLSYLEPFIIIEKFNSVIRGFANFYTEFIKNKSRLSRWFYILRYSCLKTLAQKYNTNLASIFRKFPKKRTGDSERTITCKVIQKIDGSEFTKEWTLLTYKEAVKRAKEIKREKIVANKYWQLSKGIMIPYEKSSRSLPPVTSDDYLDKISWVNIRTQASL